MDSLRGRMYFGLRGTRGGGSTRLLFRGSTATRFVMTERSPARDELEKRLRELVPNSPLHFDAENQKAAVAAAGAGGVALGFVWGWFRGRRSRRRK